MSSTRVKESRFLSSILQKRFLPQAGCLTILLAGAISSVQGQVLSINVGSQTLLAGSSSAPLTFTVNNSSGSPVAVSGLNFNLQLTGTAPFPTITGVELINTTPSTPFAGAGATENPNGSQPSTHEAYWSVANPGFPPSTVNLNPGSSTVATVTFNTTSVSSGQSWQLLLGNTSNGKTSYLNSGGNDIPITIVDGTLTIVPEPETYAAIMGAACLGFGLWRRSLTKAS